MLSQKTKKFSDGVPYLSRSIKKETRSVCFSFRGQRWIRTTEVERQQIYSLPHLATLEFAQTPFGSFAFAIAKVLLFFEKASVIHKKVNDAADISSFGAEFT